MSQSRSVAQSDLQRLTTRYQRLLMHLRTAVSAGRGWKARAAKELGISPSHLSKILSGDREVGLEVAHRAAQRLSIPMTFFTAEQISDLDLERAIRASRVVMANHPEAVFQEGFETSLGEEAKIDLATLTISAEMFLKAVRQVVHAMDDVERVGLNYEASLAIAEDAAHSASDFLLHPIILLARDLAENEGMPTAPRVMYAIGKYQHVVSGGGRKDRLRKS